MAVFEWIQLVLKDTADAETVKDHFRTHLKGWPGIDGLYLVNALRASGKEANEEGGTHVLLAWESFTGIEELKESPTLASLKAAAFPLVASLTGPQFFRPIPSLASSDDADDAVKVTTREAVVLQVIKIPAPDGTGETARTSWTAFADGIKGAEGLTGFFAGEGVLTAEGVFVGVAGWKSQKALDEALAKPGVAAKLKELEGVAGADVSSTFVLGL